MSLIRWRRPDALPVVLDDMDRWFDRFLRHPIMRAVEGEPFDFGPAIDVYETETELVVKAELPGARKEDIELIVQDDRLVLKGETRKEQEVSEEGYHRKEMHYGSFRRVIPLPTAVKQEEIAASFENGILTIRAPKSPEEAKGARVEIK